MLVVPMKLKEMQCGIVVYAVEIESLLKPVAKLFLSLQSRIGEELSTRALLLIVILE